MPKSVVILLAITLGFFLTSVPHRAGAQEGSFKRGDVMVAFNHAGREIITGSVPPDHFRLSSNSERLELTATEHGLVENAIGHCDKAASADFPIGVDLADACRESIRAMFNAGIDKKLAAQMSADDLFNISNGVVSLSEERGEKRDRIAESIFRPRIAAGIEMLRTAHASATVIPDEPTVAQDICINLLDDPKEQIAESCSEVTGLRALECRSVYYGYVSPKTYKRCPDALKEVQRDLVQFRDAALEEIKPRPAVEPPYVLTFMEGVQWLSSNLEQPFYYLSDDPAVQAIREDFLAERAEALPDAVEELEQFLRRSHGSFMYARLLTPEERAGVFGERLQVAAREGDAWIRAGNDPVRVPEPDKPARVASIPEPGPQTIVSALVAGDVSSVPDDATTRLVVNWIAVAFEEACGGFVSQSLMDVYTAPIMRQTAALPIVAAQAPLEVMAWPVAEERRQRDYRALAEQVRRSGCDSSEVRTAQDAIVRLATLRAAKEPDATAGGGVSLMQSCLDGPDVDEVDCACASTLIIMTADQGSMRAFTADFFGTLGARLSEGLTNFGVEKCLGRD